MHRERERELVERLSDEREQLKEVCGGGGGWGGLLTISFIFSLKSSEYMRLFLFVHLDGFLTFHTMIPPSAEEERRTVLSLWGAISMSHTAPRCPTKVMLSETSPAAFAATEGTTCSGESPVSQIFIVASSDPE